MDKGLNVGDFLDPGNIWFYVFLPITLPLLVLNWIFKGVF
jgi:hypothetical protein